MSSLSLHDSSTEQEHAANHEPTLDAETMIFSDPVRPSTSPSSTGGLGSKVRNGIHSPYAQSRSHKSRGSKRRNTLQTATVDRHHGYANYQRASSATRTFTASRMQQRDQSMVMTEILNRLKDLGPSETLDKDERREVTLSAQLPDSSARSSVVTQIHVPVRPRSKSPGVVGTTKHDRLATARLSLDVPRASIKRKEYSPPSTSSTTSRSIFSHPATPGTSLSSRSKSARKSKQAAPALQEEVYFGSSEGSDADSELSSVSSLSEISDTESSFNGNYEVSEEEQEDSAFVPRLSTSRARKASPKHKGRRTRSYSPPSSIRGYSSDDACPPPIARVRLERPLQQYSMSKESAKQSFKQRTLLLKPHVTSPRQDSVPTVHASVQSRPKSVRSNPPSRPSISLERAPSRAVQKGRTSDQRWTPRGLLEDYQVSDTDDGAVPPKVNSSTKSPCVNSASNTPSQKNHGSLSLRKNSFLSRFSLASSSTPKAPRSSSISHIARRPAASRYLNAAQELTLSTLAPHTLVSLDQPPTPPPKDTPPLTSELPRPLTPEKQTTPEQMIDAISPASETRPLASSSPPNRRITLQEAINTVSPPPTEGPATSTPQTATSTTAKSTQSTASASVMEAPSVPRVSYPRTSVPNRNRTKRKMSVDIAVGAVSPLPGGTTMTGLGQTTSPSKREKWLHPLEAWRLRIGKGVNRKERREAQRLEEMCRRELVGG